MNPGCRWGSLTVLRRGPQPLKGRMPRVYCLCDCGQETLVYCASLRTGNTKSCGCLRGETHGQSNFWKKGGRKESKEYKAWCHAKSRCSNPNYPKFEHYGGRGITMCQEWRDSFLAFFTYMGKCPKGLTLDRIDNEGNYEPGNCQWATRSQQNKNRRPFKMGRRRRVSASLPL